jgi:4-hydroxy-3-polyprenylbenzoate decarboxylase
VTAPALDLREYVRALEAAGELVRVREEVDPELEITEITDRTTKRGGPALLFERVQGSAIPVLTNAFGIERRLCLGVGARSIAAIASRIEEIAGLEGAAGTLGGKLQAAGAALALARIPPRRVAKGPCQEVVRKGAEVDLGRLPILKCWPKDAGRFITLPLVLTHDPETGRRNVGLYRMQVHDARTTGMHWQTQKDGAAHWRKARALGRRLEVACAIGADPATVLAGVAPLPYGVDEFLFSGFLRGRGVELVRGVTVDVEVPANAEIVLEGYVDPAEPLRPEGPFGDHTGVYTPVEDFPVFHVTCVTMRRDPIYLATLVGKPPQEDFIMGKLVERAFLPVIRKQVPEIVDMNFPLEGTFNNAVIVSIDKAYPFQARKVAHAVWGLGQLALTKVVLVVDKSVDVQNLSQVALAVFNNIDPKRDVFFVEGPVDTLNHASPERDYGSKMGVDATAKWKEEGYARAWPEEIEMDEATKRKVSEKWAQYGIQ